MAISLDDMKSHLRVTITDDDTIIGDKLATATDWVLNYTGISGDSTIPSPVNEAIRQLTAHLYANREASLVGVTAQSLPFGVLDLLTPYTPFFCG